MSLLPTKEDRAYSRGYQDGLKDAPYQLSTLTKPETPPAPIAMLLFCPLCGSQHVDRDESPSDREWAAQSAGDREQQYWTNPPHRSHLCHACGCIWRPADVATVGVKFIATKGKADTFDAQKAREYIAVTFDRALTDQLALDLKAAGVVVTADPNRVVNERAEKAEAELARLQGLVNHPELENFLRGVHVEAVHQVERWGTAHDRAKRPADWFWLVGYLAGKALHSAIAGNTDKALNHCISTAAALYNWHSAIKGVDVSMCPGRSDLAEMVDKEFPGEIN